MGECILVGCDRHDKKMVLKMAVGREESRRRDYESGPAGRAAMVRDLRAWAAELGGARILLAYEASGQGFGLYDELKAAGIECCVLAPTKIPRSPQQRKRKTDETDAEVLLNLLRGHVLAGNPLPVVEVPSRQVRDDREVLRARTDTTEKVGQVKTQIGCLLKRNEVRRPAGLGVGWTRAYREWLKALAECDEPMGAGARVALGTLLRQLGMLEEEMKGLDADVARLAKVARYEPVVTALRRHKGVAALVALIFVTEIGRPTRFRNRRKIGAHLGLAPSSYESGENGDNKGHITRQGSFRVRRALCQAVWARVRTDPEERAAYDRIVRKNPKHKKIAVVASMRRLAVRMWHTMVEVWESQGEGSPVLQVG